MTPLTPEALAELRRLAQNPGAGDPFPRYLTNATVLNLLSAAEERDRLRAELATARDAALEEAARVCDAWAESAHPRVRVANDVERGHIRGAEHCADAIRALKGDGGGG